MEYYENDWDMYWDIVEDMYQQPVRGRARRRTDGYGVIVH